MAGLPYPNQTMPPTGSGSQDRDWVTVAYMQYQRATGRSPRQRSGGTRPYLGVVPDFSVEGPGCAIRGVADGGPASRGGLRAGDVIVQFGDSKIGSLEDLDVALRKHKGGDKVKVVVHRGEEEAALEVTLAPSR